MTAREEDSWEKLLGRWCWSMMMKKEAGKASLKYRDWGAYRINKYHFCKIKAATSGQASFFQIQKGKCSPRLAIDCLLLCSWGVWPGPASQQPYVSGRSELRPWLDGVVRRVSVIHCPTPTLGAILVYAMRCIQLAFVYYCVFYCSGPNFWPCELRLDKDSVIFANWATTVMVTSLHLHGHGKWCPKKSLTVIQTKLSPSLSIFATRVWSII